MSAFVEAVDAFGRTQANSCAFFNTKGETLNLNGKIDRKALSEMAGDN